VAKGKANTIIKKATASSHATRNPHSDDTASRTASAERNIFPLPCTSLSPQPSSSSPASELPEWQSLQSESLSSRGTLMEDIQKTIQASIVEALTGLGTGDIAASRDGTDPLISSATLTSRLDMPQHILSRWPWVPEDTIKSIAIGNFEINSLLKLHRSDDLRNAYLKHSMKGIYQPLDGGPPEIIVGTSKLHASFSNPTTFFLAWHIYVSIRAEFKPEMGIRLAY
jgi:hypothetical protein